MSRFRHLIAVVLLAVWLPATTHCGWEISMEVAATDCCGEHGADSSAALDHCVVESGGYFANQATVTINAPALLTFWDGETLRIDPPEVVLPVAHGRVEAPPELPRTWQFTARAALPARAPSLVS